MIGYNKSQYLMFLLKYAISAQKSEENTKRGWSDDKNVCVPACLENRPGS